MKKIIAYPAIALMAAMAAASPARADRHATVPERAKLKVTLGGVDKKGMLQAKHAFCVLDAKNHTAYGQNISPALRWSKGPEGTRSYVIVAVDPDVPTVLEDINRDGKTIPADQPRQPFHHWLLADVPAKVTALPEGADSRELTKGGKPAGPTKYGVRGANDYSVFLANDPQMKGIYGGYDGSCPPWNDARMHHYHFQVYALDVERLNLRDGFTGKDVMNAIAPHILARGEAVAQYSLNPAVLKAVR